MTDQPKDAPTAPADSERSSVVPARQQLLSTTAAELMILPLATVLAYVAAFAYESAYATYFGLPHEFISIDASLLLASGVGIGGFAALLYWYVVGILQVGAVLASKASGKAGRVMLSFVLYVLMFFVAATAYGIFSFPVGVIACIVGFHLLFDVFWAFIRWWEGRSSPNSKGFVEHYVDKATEPDELPFDLTKVVKTHLGGRVLLLWVFVLCVLGLAHAAGFGQARRERWFTINRDDGLVLLRKYGDVVLFKDFNPATGEILPVVRVFTTEELREMGLSHRRFREVIVVPPNTPTEEAADETQKSEANAGGAQTPKAESTAIDGQQ